MAVNEYNVIFYRYDLKYEWFLDDWAEDSTKEGDGKEPPDAATAEADDIISHIAVYYGKIYITLNFRLNLKHKHFWNQNLELWNSGFQCPTLKFDDEP